MKFKVGDIVKLLDKNNYFHPKCVNMIAKIFDINDAKGCYILDVDAEIKEQICEFKYQENMEKIDSSPLNEQTGGSHYKDLKIQPIEYNTANNLTFSQGNVIKYVTRYKNKNGAEDLKKAIHMLKLMLELEYNEK